jgi:hypothetical protein
MKFTFVRHGEGCHNMISKHSQSLGKESYSRLVEMTSDPELTKAGAIISTYNGNVIKPIIGKVHIVCCSPLLRSMETAYFMSRGWGTDAPSKIFVVPFLRELDESNMKGKYSIKSRMRIDTLGVYQMSTIDNQKKHLMKYAVARDKSLVDFFDFTFVEQRDKSFLQPAVKPFLKNGRREPGDIPTFMKWAKTVMLSQLGLQGQNVSLVAVTHAGVLKDFVHAIQEDRDLGPQLRVDQSCKNNVSPQFYNNEGVLLNVVDKGSHLRVNSAKQLSRGTYKNIDSCDVSDGSDNSRCGYVCNALHDAE